jgi:hypothetical protein
MRLAAFPVRATAELFSGFFRITFMYTPVFQCTTDAGGFFVTFSLQPGAEQEQISKVHGAKWQMD